ncbi:MAG TPA: IPExxxVDY family protein [Bacteroidetes bacterium]|nr:IPExxxVDY family protein [Bacteroidota bacterium]
MKTPQKKIRHKLSVKDHDSDLYLGLASAEADYRVSLLLNKELRLNFKSSTPVTKALNKRESSFSRFTSESGYSETSYELISNDSGNDKLIPRIPSIDYILRIKGLNPALSTDKIISQIRQIKEITGVFKLDKDTQIDNSVLQIMP